MWEIVKSHYSKMLKIAMYFTSVDPKEYSCKLNEAKETENQ